MMLAVARGLGKARDWARHTLGACSALLVLSLAANVFVDWHIKSPDMLTAIVVIVLLVHWLYGAFYWWRPPTAERFRQARAAIARYEQAR